MARSPYATTDLRASVEKPATGPREASLSGQFEAVEEIALRLTELMFPLAADMTVLSVNVDDETVRIENCSTAEGLRVRIVGGHEDFTPSLAVSGPARTPTPSTHAWRMPWSAIYALCRGFSSD